MTSSTSTLMIDGTDLDHRISTGRLNSRLRPETLVVFPCQNLLDAVRFILDNNLEGKNNATLTEHQVEMLEIIENLRQSPRVMFQYLHKRFANHFDIDLYIIAYEAGQFTLITNGSCEKENKAYLRFHEDHTVDGPLYDILVDGTKQTIFSTSDFEIELFVSFYILELNDHRELSFDLLNRQKADCDDLGGSVTCARPVVGALDPGASDPSVPSVASSSAYQNVFEHIHRLFESLGIDPQIIRQVTEPLMLSAALEEPSSLGDILVALNDGIDCLSQLAKIFQLAVPVNGNALVATTPTSVSDDPPYSSTTNHHSDSDQTSELTTMSTEVDLIPPHGTGPSAHDTPLNEQICHITYSYRPPTLSKSLKSPFHPRTLKEFAATGSSPVQCVESKQREPLHIEVPSADDVTLYLGLMMCTKENGVHPSKVVVPDKTEVEGQQLMNNNDLSCLKFEKCSPDDKFVLEKGHIYSKISRQERLTKQKDIRIHILNLYQRGSLDRKKVHGEHLKQAKLALWFATCEKGTYQPVSEVFLSNTIEESMPASSASKRSASKQNQKVSKKAKTTVE